jgi:hypothetical protein
MITDLFILLADTTRLFGIKLINTQDFFELLIRFIFNILVVLVIIRYMYYPIAKRKDYFFTYLMVSAIVFLLSFALLNVEYISIGVGLGLFALFGILRFRTSQIPMKEMSYLFMVIAISVINAMVTKKTSYAELFLINFVLLIVTWAGERFWLNRAESQKTIVDEKIDLIKPENRELLIKDLEERTGLKILRIEVGRIDFLRDTARIRIYYQTNNNQGHFEDFDGGDNDF